MTEELVPEDAPHLKKFHDAYVTWCLAFNNAITAERQGNKDEEIRLGQLANNSFTEVKEVVKEEARKKGSQVFEEFRYLESIPPQMRGSMNYLMHNLFLALLDDLKE